MSVRAASKRDAWECFGNKAWEGESDGRRVVKDRAVHELGDRGSRSKTEGAVGTVRTGDAMSDGTIDFEQEHVTLVLGKFPVAGRGCFGHGISNGSECAWLQLSISWRDGGIKVVARHTTVNGRRSSKVKLVSLSGEGFNHKAAGSPFDRDEYA